MARIKKVNGKKGNRIGINHESESKMRVLEHPIFCLKFLHSDYGLDKCTKDEKVQLLERFYKLSQMTWQQIQQADRHGLGSEKISRDSLKASIPNIVSEDDTFLALRFSSKAPFVGFRRKNIFHVLYVDNRFKLYDH